MPNRLFGQNFQKKGVKQKSEHDHQILHIQNSSITKFQIKLTILNFCTKLTQNKFNIFEFV